MHLQKQRSIRRPRRSQCGWFKF